MITCFLDIDGVFTSERLHLASFASNKHFWQWFDPVALKFFDTLPYHYDIEYVMHSSWLLTNNKFSEYRSMFYGHENFVQHFADNWRVDKTDDGDHVDMREREILSYCMNEHIDLNDILIIDDDAKEFNELKSYCIFTDYYDGMLEKHYKEILKRCKTMAG